MPISIKELHIKINVQDDGQSTTSNAQAPGDKKDKMIEACLEQVVAMQRRKKER